MDSRTQMVQLGAGTVLGGETVTVIIKGLKFHPEEIKVKVGTIIRWENQDEMQYHSVLFPGMSDKKVDYFFLVISGSAASTCRVPIIIFVNRISNHTI